MLFIIGINIFLSPVVAFAQEAVVPTPDEVVEETLSESEVPVAYGLEAVISGDTNVEIKKNIIFSAVSSDYDKTKPVKFTWNLGDGSIVEGEEVVHAYTTPGKHIVSLTVEQDKKKSSIDSVIFVYEKIMILVTDETIKQKKIYTVIEEVKQEGIFVELIDNFSAQSSLNSAETFNAHLKENFKSIEKSEIIYIWPKKTIDFGFLTTFYQDTIQRNIDYSEKTFVFITNENISNIGNFSQNIFDIIEPKQIIITREDAFTPSIISTENVDVFIQELQNFTDFQLINEESRGYLVFNLVSEVIQFMLKSGLPSNTIILILIFPLIASIIAFFRQVLGITTFGIFTPSIVSLSFIVLSLKFGLLIFLILLFSVSIIRLFLSRFRLLYIPKVAITITASSFIILMTMAIGMYYKIAEVTVLAVFPMLIMTTFSEKFVNVQSGKGIKTALIGSIQTLFVILVSYFIVTLDIVQAYALSSPGWLFIIIIIINIFLGKYTGLRLSEYFRFREIFSHMEE